MQFWEEMSCVKNLGISMVLHHHQAHDFHHLTRNWHASRSKDSALWLATSGKEFVGWDQKVLVYSSQGAARVGSRPAWEAGYKACNHASNGDGGSFRYKFPWWMMSIPKLPFPNPTWHTNACKSELSRLPTLTIYPLRFIFTREHHNAANVFRSICQWIN
jgi:hypothetical protein